MAFKLVVTEPFGDYQRGDEIQDAKKVKAILDSEHAGHVVKAQVPEDDPAK